MRLPALLTIVLGLAILQTVYAVFLLWGLSLSEAASFGDMFGGFSALVNSAAFAAIAATLYLQQQQLAFTRAEARRELVIRRLMLQLDVAIRKQARFDQTHSHYHDGDREIDEIVRQILSLVDEMKMPGTSSR